METNIVTALITLCLPVSVFTTTLRPSTDVDLLILDGKKVSSPLLRGVDSIELGNGPHQLVFHVEKTTHLSGNEGRLYISPPLVASFNARLINQVNFRLPRLKSGQEADHSDAVPHLELLDGNATPVPVKPDILAITSAAKAINYEVGVECYDKSAKRASLSRFATMMASDSTLLSGIFELDAIPPRSRVLTEQRLKYQFKLADPRAQDTFLQWTEKQPSP